MVPAPAVSVWPGNLLEMHILRPHPGPLSQKTWRWVLINPPGDSPAHSHVGITLQNSHSQCWLFTAVTWRTSKIANLIGLWCGLIIWIKKKKNIPNDFIICSKVENVCPREFPNSVSKFNVRARPSMDLPDWFSFSPTTVCGDFTQDYNVRKPLKQSGGCLVPNLDIGLKRIRTEFQIALGTSINRGKKRNPISF